VLGIKRGSGLLLSSLSNYPDLKRTDYHNERELIAALSRGEAGAFDRVFDLYGRRLYAFSMDYLKSREEAQEVVQEVFYKIWKNRASLNPALSFKAYVFKIAFNHIRELFVKLARERNYLNEIVRDSVVFTTDMDEQTNYQSLLEMVDRLIGELPARQKEILIMRKKEGRPVKEIATELGLSAKTVENHITEAMNRIRKSLEGEQLAGILFFSLFVSY